MRFTTVNFMMSWRIYRGSLPTKLKSPKPLSLSLNWHVDTSPTNHDWLVFVSCACFHLLSLGLASSVTSGFKPYACDALILAPEREVTGFLLLLVSSIAEPY